MKNKTTLAALLLAAVMVTPGYGADEHLTGGVKETLFITLFFGFWAVVGYVVYRIQLKENGPRPSLETASDVWDGICGVGGAIALIGLVVTTLVRWAGS